MASARAVPSTTSRATASPPLAAATMVAGSRALPARDEERAARPASALRLQPAIPATVSTQPLEPQPHGAPRRLDLDVADLAGVAALAGPDPALQQDPATDTRAQGHEQEVLRAPSRADPGLGQGRRVGVVLEERGPARPSRHLRAQGEAVQLRQVRTREDAGAAVLHDPRNPDPDRGGGAVRVQGPHSPLELIDQRVAARAGDGVVKARRDPACPFDPGSLQVRPTHVEGDEWSRGGLEGHPGIMVRARHLSTGFERPAFPLNRRDFGGRTVYPGPWRKNRCSGRSSRSMTPR